jgi:hypothetical protein
MVEVGAHVVLYPQMKKVVGIFNTVSWEDVQALYLSNIIN